MFGSDTISGSCKEDRRPVPRFRLAVEADRTRADEESSQGSVKTDGDGVTDATDGAKAVRYLAYGRSAMDGHAYLRDRRHPAASACASVQNHRSPFDVSMRVRS